MIVCLKNYTNGIKYRSINNSNANVRSMQALRTRIIIYFLLEGYMENVKIYHLLWEKVEYQDFESLNEKKHYGIYQIYGDHPIYGRDILLYIGKAQEQTFAQRLSQHDDFEETNLRITKLYIGMFLNMDDNNYVNWGDSIDEAEKILIKAHCPAYNSSMIKGIITDDSLSNIVIFNWGDFGQLLPEISGLRFSKKYWDNWDEKAKYLEEK